MTEPFQFTEAELNAVIEANAASLKSRIAFLEEANAASHKHCDELTVELTAAQARVAELERQTKDCLFWFNLDGSPCDGPRFREEFEKLRQLLGYDGTKVHDYAYRNENQ